ncbi:MAG: hypothetical protein RL095_1156 [Verrucomicrobiota bacterium]|jgi:thiamine biosynthesis lipoprotein ApbE
MIKNLLICLFCLLQAPEPGKSESAVPPAAETSLLDAELYLEDVMGSWLEIRLAARDEAARDAAEALARNELSRLAAIFDRRDPASEISRLCAGRGRQVCSLELAQVLRLAKEMQELSGGRFSPGIAPVLAAWKEGRPSPDKLAAACREASRLADYQLSESSGDHFFIRAGPGPLDLDALCGGFIADALLRRLSSVPGIEAALVNVSGDIACSPGNHPWSVSIPDPARRAENLPGLAEFPAPRAISSSGGTERHADAQGRHSHIVDARSGLPADASLCCSVIAPSCAEADGLATALSLLPPDEAQRLVAARPGCSLLQIGSDGTLAASPEFPAVARRFAAPAAAAGVEIAFQLSNSTPKGKFKNHFTAVWIEDAAGKKIADLALWGRKAKYYPSLKAWWKAGGKDSVKKAEVMKVISGPSRAPGAHSLVWDLTDASGKPVKPGKYTLCVEVNREHGPDKEKPILGKVAFDTAKKAFAEKGKDCSEILKLSVSRKP